MEDVMKKMLLFAIVVLLATTMVFSQSWEVVKKGEVPSVNTSTFLDANTGWLVGDEGLVHKTTDGGNTWTVVREAVPESDDWVSVDFANADVGYACADAGMIFKTEDGGDTWTMVGDTSNYQADLEFVEAIDANLVYISGEDSTMLKTEDGGDTYTLSDCTFNGEDLDGGLAFTDANCGVVISDGNGGNTWYTHDGGDTWNFVPVGSNWPPGTISSRIYDIAAAGDSTFLISGYHYVTVISHDGGKTYERIGNVSYDYVRNELVEMITPDEFYLAGEYVAKTTDGGSTWDTLTVGSAQSMIDLVMTDADNGYLFMNYGHWMKTTDGGSSWSPLLDWPAISFWGLSTPTDNKIVLSAWGGGEISISEDGGNTFSYPSNAATGAMSHLYECEFIDADNGIVAGEDGFIGVTEDGGATWTSVTNPMQEVRFGTYNALKYASPDTIYGSGDDGLIFRSPDGGYTWNPVSSEGEEDILDFWTFGPEDVVTAGDDGLICAIKPGVDSFAVVDTLYHEKDIRAVEYKNDVGLFVTSGAYNAGGGTVNRITTGDDTAAVVFTEPDGDDIYDVEFVNDTLAFIVGENGKIYRSGDAGVTWTAEDSLTDVTLQKTSYKNGKLWVVGQGGVVLKKMIEEVNVDNGNKTLPTEFSLEQNYPNPFNPTTIISFALPKATDVKLIVYNLVGQEVATIKDGHMKAGQYEMSFDAENLASGIYFYRLKAGSYTQLRKMTLLK